MATRKSIFITGGGSGIGRAVAVHFAGKGWFVGLGDINGAGMAETGALLPPGQWSAHKLDVRDRAAWETALADFAKVAGGQIDVVHNNAGVGVGGQFVDWTPQEVDLTIDVNFKGVVIGAQVAYPYLKASAPGSCLLNTASASALYGTGGLAIYSATKFAVRALTEALDTEWGDEGIRVRSLMPSFIDTPLLAGPASANTNVSKRDRVIEAGMEFTPVETVAQCAWDAVHGARLHTLVGKTAKQMAFAAKWTPGYLRKRAKRLMEVRAGEG